MIWNFVGSCISRELAGKDETKNWTRLETSRVKFYNVALRDRVLFKMQVQIFNVECLSWRRVKNLLYIVHFLSVAMKIS